MIKLKYTGEYDFWSRRLLTDGKNRYAEVDGIPHPLTDWGEPLYPLKDYKIVDELPDNK